MDAAVELARRVDPRLLAGAIGLCIAFFATMGTIHLHDPASQFQLDTDNTIPARVSAALLFGAAIACLLALRVSKGSRGVWLAMAVAFTYLGVDEWRAVHERLEDAAGIDWQLLYIPLAAPVAIAWAMVLKVLRPYQPSRTLFALGAGAWLLAVGLEAEVGLTEQSVNPGFIVVEEVLEFAGSSLFLLGALVFLRLSVAPAPRSR